MLEELNQLKITLDTEQTNLDELQVATSNLETAGETPPVKMTSDIAKLESSIFSLQEQIEDMQRHIVYLEVLDGDIKAEHTHDTDAIALTPYYKKDILEDLIGKILLNGVATDKVLTLVEEQQVLLKELRVIYQLKKQACLDYISDTDYTKEIDDEYKTKLKLATEAIASSDFSVFEIDAKALTALKGSIVTAEEYAQLIVGKGAQMLPAKDAAVLRMGTVRTIIAGLINAGALVKASEVLEKVKNVDAGTIVTASEAEILGLLA